MEMKPHRKVLGRSPLSDVETIQTMTGIWLAKAQNIEPFTLAMDLEGPDRRERGELSSSMYNDDDDDKNNKKKPFSSSAYSRKTLVQLKREKMFVSRRKIQKDRNVEPEFEDTDAQIVVDPKEAPAPSPS